MSIFRKAFALVCSVTVAFIATTALWAYLDAAHSLNNTYKQVALFLAFGLVWYGTWKYLSAAGSLAMVKSRSWAALKVVAAGSVLLAGLWLLGLILGWGDEPSTVLQCDDCPLVVVTHVRDGDTLESGLEAIRLYGVDTPEVGERCAEGATSRLVELAGQRVRVEAGPRSRDVYGRTLAYLYTEDGRSIDELLVIEGHAEAWTRDGQHRDYLGALEHEARAKGAGCLW